MPPPPHRVYTRTLKKKNRLAPLGSSQLLPAKYNPQGSGSGALSQPYSYRTGLAVPYSHKSKSKSASSLHLPSVRRLETMMLACWKGCALGRAGHKPAAPQERKGCSFLALCILHTYAASCGYVSTGQCSTPRFARTKPYASLRSHHRSVHAHRTGGSGLSSPAICGISFVTSRKFLKFLHFLHSRSLQPQPPNPLSSPPLPPAY